MGVRRQTAEHPFGTIKCWMGATHFLTKSCQRWPPRWLAHPTRFERVTFAFGAQRPVQTLHLLSRRKPLKQFAATPHQSSSVARKFPCRRCCPNALEQPSPCAVVRGSPRAFALTLIAAQQIIVPSSFAKWEGPLRYSRRGSSGREELPTTPSNPPSEELKSLPFVQRLTCTINEACEVTGLGRTKLYELIGTGHLTTTTVGRRRLVHVSSLQALLDVDPSEPGGMKKLVALLGL
jgi:excisionase family DNA binding protein